MENQQKNKVLEWANERGLLKPENAPLQMLKSFSEMGELADAIAKKDQNGIVDGLGDVMVTLIILAEQLGYNLDDCLESAYNEIKNRKGKTVGGIFIKDDKVN